MASRRKYSRKPPDGSPHHRAKSARTPRRTRRCSSRSPRRASARTNCRRSTCPPWMPQALLGAAHRDTPGLLPELSEIEIIRHFTRLSTWNYAIDLGMYPLGSCTMKYNPRVNEFVARIEGLAEAHPYRPESLAQGILEVFDLLQRCLLEITGMDAITLQPAAGAHGEFTGILLTRAWHESQGNPRKKILIPDSAHGTNPATAAICGYTVENLKSNADGGIDLEALERQVDEETAALMLTNPSTLGVFENQIHKIADILHAKGALLYMDGANMNALVGKVRPGDFGVDVMHLNLHKTFSTPHGGGGPGSGPVACKAFLEPFLPIPVLVRTGRNEAIEGTSEPTAEVTTGLRERERRRPSRYRAALGLQPAAIRRPRARLLRQYRHVYPRAGLHSGQRSRRPAPDHGRRGAERQLHPQEARRPVRAALQNSLDARGGLQRQAAGGARRQRPATSPSGSSTTASIPTRSASRSSCTAR